MSTLQQLKTKIANDLHRTDLDTQIAEAIDAAIAHYNREHFWFLETSYVFTTSATTTYSVPSDFIGPATFQITYSGSKSPLDYITYSEMDDEDTGIVSGIPDSVALYGGNFRLYPTPNGSYPVTVSYHRSLDAPSDGGSNAWTSEAEQLIRFRATWDIYHNHLRNPEMAQAAKMSESEAFSSLVSNNVKRLSTGTLKKSGW